MDILDSIKNIKKITPDAEYSAKSKQLILQTTPLPYKKDPWRAFRWLGDSIQFGSAIALTGLFVVLVAGGFTIISKILTLNNFAAFNRTDIQAEAKDIDMQIQLAQLNAYQPPISAAQSTPSTDKKTASSLATVENISEQEKNIGDGTAGNAAVITTSSPSASTSSSDEPTIDQALDAVSTP